MAVYDGSPSIRLEGDQKRALALIPEGKLLLQKVQGLIKNADVPTYSMTRRVDADSYIYVLCSSGQNIIHISVAPTVVDVVVDEPILTEGELFPSFYSGLVFDGYLEEREKVLEDGTVVKYKVAVSFDPTPTCARISKIVDQRIVSGRLAVLPDNGMGELRAPSESRREYSQYTKLRASMYSGTMAKVVQIVMGLGRLKPNQLPEDVSKRYRDSVRDNGVQVRYDYKFVRTHGITRAADGRLWMVEVSITRGVIAMLLPIFKDSNKPYYRLKAEARGDSAMQTALEELKCLPTGEGFPNGQAYAAMKARGELLELLPAEALTDFYSNSAFASSCGWAFSESGREAHNVCYGYLENDPIQKSYWYQISIDIGALKAKREPGEPIATASASLRIQRRGSLYAPTRKPFLGLIPVKYFEPLMSPPQLVMHSAAALDGGNDHKVISDGPVFVGFINGSLKTANFYANNKLVLESTTETDIGPGDCLLEGSWSTTTRTGPAFIPRMPYTTDFDVRKEIWAGEIKSTFESRGAAYGGLYLTIFVDDVRWAALHRVRVFTTHYTWEYRGGEQLGAMLIMPSYAREAYYFVEGSYFTDKHSGTENVGEKYHVDPNYGLGWAGLTGYGPGVAEKQGCSMKACGGKHTDRKVMCTKYDDTMPCGEFADTGQWLSQCSTIQEYAKAAPKYPSWNRSWDAGRDFNGTISFTCTGLLTPFKTKITEAEYEAFMEPREGQVIAAVYSAIGEDSVVFHEKLSGPTRVTGYVPTAQQVFAMPTFIGVNQP